MAENTSISWCTHTWNPVIGCLKISPACDSCYAENLMDTRYGRVTWGAPGKGPGTRVRTSKSTWDAPFKWNRQAEKNGTRPFVICASLSDVFDNQWDPQWRADAFEVMRKTPNLVYLLLTKRPQNIVKMSMEAGGLPENSAIGTTVEDQLRADTNLLALTGASLLTRPLFTFGSFEPLLGPIMVPPGLMPDWVITGGETDQGPNKARPTNPDWFRMLRDQAMAAGVAYHHKQNGEWVAAGHDSITDATEHLAVDHSLGRLMVKVGHRRSGRLLDGVEHNEFPKVA